MKNRSIVFTSVNTAEIVSDEVRLPKENEVLVRTSYSVISAGTERANITGDVNVSIYDRSGVAVFPRYGGYSSSGTVVETGSGVKELKPGDRVAMSWSVHSEYQTLNASNVHLIENSEVQLEDAAFAHISTFPMAAVRKCRVELGEPALVMGMGILGRIAIMLLKAAGAYPVIAMNRGDRWFEMAKSLGADYTVSSDSADFADTVRTLSYGGAAAAIEVTGSGQALDRVLDCMRPMGRVALLGCTRSSDFTIDYYHKVHGPGISLIGAHTRARPESESAPFLWTTHDDAETFLRLAAAKRIDAGMLRERMCRPEDASWLYSELASGKTFPVTEFDWT